MAHLEAGFTRLDTVPLEIVPLQIDKHEQGVEMVKSITTIRGAKLNAALVTKDSVELNNNNEGYAYLLVSTRDLTHIYLGSTKNLANRLKQHNAGDGSQQTQSKNLRPWAVLAYIVGFDENKAAHESIKNNWIAQKQDLLSNPRVQASVQVIHNIGKDIINTYNIVHRDNGKLPRFISCGTIESVVTATGECPPAHGNEGIIPPVFAGLIAINPNMSNVQFATGYTLSRYLAKYIVAVDLYNTIRITPPKQ